MSGSHHHHSQMQHQSHHHSQMQHQSHHHHPAEHHDHQHHHPAEHHDHHHHHQPPKYGTFQVVPYAPQYYAHGYQTVPGHVVAEGTPVRHHQLPCCGIGMGWFLFIIGFFLAAIPWYVAAFILLCAKNDPREKPGYIACTVAAVLVTIAVILAVNYED